MTTAPSIGRVVWVNMPVRSDQLCAGLVTYVHEDHLVNVACFDRNGDLHPMTFVNFYHGDDGKIPVGQCGWMPYQVQSETKAKATADQTTTNEHTKRISELEKQVSELLRVTTRLSQTSAPNTAAQVANPSVLGSPKASPAIPPPGAAKSEGSK